VAIKKHHLKSNLKNKFNSFYASEEIILIRQILLILPSQGLDDI
jgi:hypothetical protein